MKHLLIFLALCLFSNHSSSQVGVKYLRYGKLTTAQLEQIDRSDTSYVYTAFDTDLGIEVIDIGNG